MAGSRAAWQDQSAPPLTPAERKANATSKEKKLVDYVPGDKGSTVDKIREANKKRKAAMEQE